MISVRGRGSLPTTAANAALGVRGFMKAALGVRFFAGAAVAVVAFFAVAIFYFPCWDELCQSSRTEVLLEVVEANANRKISPFQAGEPVFSQVLLQESTYRQKSRCCPMQIPWRMGRFDRL